MPYFAMAEPPPRANQPDDENPDNHASSPVLQRTAMQLGVDSFAARPLDADASGVTSSESLRNLIDRIERADQVGLDVFGVGEHHRADYLDSAPALILAAAATRTERIRLTSAVTVLSAADPVRVFQSFATLDLLSRGRAELVVGRGSFIESFPLFGLQLEDYNSLFAEKLDLLLQLRDHEHVHWSGEHRPALTGQGVYPRPLQNPLPIWIGIGGTPESAIRAGALGLPLMIAIIGGETRRFRPLVDLYREAGRRAGHPPEQLKVGVHALGYVAETTEQGIDDFYPGYARTFTKVGKERGWPPVTRTHFDALRSEHGALLVGNPEEVAAKIVGHSAALGGIARLTFQMDVAGLSQARHLRGIELLGTRVAPLLRTLMAPAPLAL
jgi:probable LLM family oxidoreductase